MGGSTMVEEVIELTNIIPPDYFKPQKNGKTIKKTFDDVYKKIKILHQRLKILEEKK